MLTAQRSDAKPDNTAKRAPRPTPKERRAAGKALRADAPLESHASFDRTPASRDPLTLLEEQAVDRVPELVPIRYGRMLQSPFAYYRGAARVMAADLAGAPRSGLTVQMCGDAHVSNFGLYGSPERRLVFDANDFDETLPGPFEHDVKRLVASLVVAARENGLGRKQRRALAIAAGARYREAMAGFAGPRDIDVWYSHIDADDLQQRLAPQLHGGPRKRLERALEKARTRDTLQAFGKLTEVVDGRLRIRAEPPLLVPLRDLMPGDGGARPRVGVPRADPPVPRVAAVRPAHAARALLVRRHGPQGRRRRQRRHPLLGRPAHRPRRATTRCCSRSRRQRRRCTRSSSARAGTRTRDSGWSPASG